MINTDKYIVDPEDPRYQSRVAEFHKSFATTGVCVLDDFVKPELIAEAINNAKGKEQEAYYNLEKSNPYLEPVDTSLPKDDPRGMEGITTLKVIANDEIPEDTPLRKFYNEPHLTSFIRDIVGFANLYQYECPLGSLNMAIMNEGDKVRWHFDISDFVVTLALQNPEDGGHFEYVHNLRQPGKQNHHGVRKVLEGDRTEVQRLNAKPGTLVIFQGINTLHRVSPIKGTKQRINALLGFSPEPGADSSPFVKKMRYGRTQPRTM